ncbi:hypothetical protein [Umezawaea sp.]|uniref:hypothetical protein n=1 Tax=Umezawaea sp. TaxID=1955258 RepID=UPI002ED60163
MGKRRGSGRVFGPIRARRLRGGGRQVFEADVISSNGLDDRRVSRGVIEHAQELMADAVGAEHAFFSTCGSSLSVRSAVLPVAGPHEKLLVARQSHKSVVSGLILSGVAAVRVRPRWDADLHLSNPPAAEDVREAFEAEPDAPGHADRPRHVRRHRGRGGGAPRVRRAADRGRGVARTCRSTPTCRRGRWTRARTSA